MEGRAVTWIADPGDRGHAWRTELSGESELPFGMINGARGPVSANWR